MQILTNVHFCIIFNPLFKSFREYSCNPISHVFILNFTKTNNQNLFHFYTLCHNIIYSKQPFYMKANFHLAILWVLIYYYLPSTLLLNLYF